MLNSIIKSRLLERREPPVTLLNQDYLRGESHLIAYLPYLQALPDGGIPKKAALAEMLNSYYAAIYNFAKSIQIVVGGERNSDFSKKWEVLLRKHQGSDF